MHQLSGDIVRIFPRDDVSAAFRVRREEIGAQCVVSHGAERTRAESANRRSRTAREDSPLEHWPKRLVPTLNSVDQSEPDWKDVPDEALVRWREVFSHSRDGLDVEGVCPVCSHETLHRWFHLHRAEPTEWHGEPWAGRGSQWQWCADCRTYEHSSGLVPMWWDASELHVDQESLMHDPGPIERARRTPG
jgi:hypothetical protein